jgi:carbon monoxide dehydrogenase subunit G
MKKLAIAIPLLLVPSLAFVQAQTNASVAGKWELHSSVQGSDFDTECTVAQTGTDLTGTCSTQGSDVKLTGKVDGTKISWKAESEFAGAPLTMQYSGTLDSGKMSGTINVVQYSVGGDFTGTIEASTNASTAATATVSGTAAAPSGQTQGGSSLSGKWSVHSSIAGNDSDSDCTFVQTGTDLTGSCSAAGSDSKVTGKVDDTKISWQYDFQYNGSPLTMKFSGTLDSGKVTGQVTVAQYGVGGDFTAARKS